MEGEPTTSPGNAFIVETGMMLVALRESLADERVADGALRSVIWQGQRKALSLEEQDAQPADIGIDAQRVCRLSTATTKKWMVGCFRSLCGTHDARETTRSRAEGYGIMGAALRGDHQTTLADLQHDEADFKCS